MPKRLLAGLLLVAIMASCSLNSRITKADKKFALGEYYKAAEMYRKIYPRVSSKKQRKLKGEVAFKMGNSYRIIESNRRAETGFKNAVRYGCRDSLLYYYYAEVLRRNGKYNEALKMYQRYEKLFPESELARNGIESCEKALDEWKEKTRYVVTKDPVMNSRYSDFCPVFASSDADVVYFNSTRIPKGTKSKNSNITGQRNNEIYTTRKNAREQWEEPGLVEGEDINTEFDEGACAFSPDYQQMYFTVSKVEKGKTLGAAIYVSNRSGGEWTKPELVKLVEDSTISTAHPAMSPDGKYLYFVSDMPGGFGGKDIWRSAKEGEGWGYPENLGPEINTPGEEMFPSFRQDGTLYFSSDGHQGLGGLDIFAAKPEQSSDSVPTWRIENLLQPINSRADDFGITFAPDGEGGFFSSNRNDRKFYDAIFRFEIPQYDYTLRGTVSDTDGEPVSDASVKIVGNDGTIASVKVNKKGEYGFAAAKNTKYVMRATCRAYLNNKQSVEVGDDQEDKSYETDFTLSLIDKPVKMNNIFFKFGSAELTPESSAGLDDLVKLLQDNPNITIEIGAHTDYVGSDEDNFKLSSQRAQAVVDYLLAKGIEQARLTAKGYGESQPVVPDKALVRKNRFLRVGVPLTEEYVSKLDDKQKEIANGLNRRTEFKVLKTTYNMF